MKWNGLSSLGWDWGCKGEEVEGEEEEEEERDWKADAAAKGKDLVILMYSLSQFPVLAVRRHYLGGPGGNRGRQMGNRKQ